MRVTTTSVPSATTRSSMEYMQDRTVHHELSLPGLNDTFKKNILEDENKRLRQSLRRSRSVLGTPVANVMVAGAGFSLGKPSPHAGGRRESRTAGGRRDKKKNLGRAWRAPGFGEEFERSMNDESSGDATVNSSAMNLTADRGDANEWKLRYTKLEKLVKMVLRPSLAFARDEGETLKARNIEVEALLKRQNAEIIPLREAHAQLQIDYDALFARLPNNPLAEIPTQTDVVWVDPLEMEQLKQEVEVAVSDTKSAQTHLAEQKFLGAVARLQMGACFFQ